MPVSLMVLWAGAPAEAVDLDVVVEAWTLTVDGQNGSNGEDRATGVAFDSDGNIVAVGWLDGAIDHGTDSYVVQYAQSGAKMWDLLQDAGPVGADRNNSDDKLYALSLEPDTDAVTLCGRKAPDNAAQADARYLVQAYGPAGGKVPTKLWEITYADGLAANSPVNECFSVDHDLGTVFASGWTEHNQTISAGRWYSFILKEDDAFIYDQFNYNLVNWGAVPDQAYGVAINPLYSDYVVVGQRGVSGLPTSVFNDADWFVQYYHYDVATDVRELKWEHAHDYGALLDRANAVAVDELGGGDVYVAGSVNVGADNGNGRNDDWYVLKYDKDGDGLGFPLPVWTMRYESATGASEQATAIAVDDSGDVLVAGTRVDPTTGHTVWRLAKYSSLDGSEIEEWVGPVGTGDAVPYSVAVRDGRIVLAGTVPGIDDGADFAITFLDDDRDGDKVADAVDGCADDPEKSEPGVCGCGVLDQDTDGDMVLNCVDECPANPDKVEPGLCGCNISDMDTDKDGTPDCDDNCDTDPEKVDWGVCGCNAPDSDSDGDGVLGCNDACSNTPSGTDVDENGCPIVEGTTTDTGDDEGRGGGGGGCGCDGTGTPVPAILGLAMLVPALRRRRST